MSENNQNSALAADVTAALRGANSLYDLLVAVAADPRLGRVDAFNEAVADNAQEEIALQRASVIWGGSFLTATKLVEAPEGIQLPLLATVALKELDRRGMGIVVIEGAPKTLPPETIESLQGIVNVFSAFPTEPSSVQ